jgi:transcriptional regulator with XRE-family HTH domain
LGTRREAAEKTGIEIGSLMRYIKKPGATIPADALAKLATTAGVRLDWIILGKGAMREEELSLDPAGEPRSAQTPEKEKPPQEHPAKRYDREILMEVIVEMERYFEEEDMDPEPERRAKLIALMYEIRVISDHIDREEMKSLIRVAA